MIHYSVTVKPGHTNVKNLINYKLNLILVDINYEKYLNIKKKKKMRGKCQRN